MRPERSLPLLRASLALLVFSLAASAFGHDWFRHLITSGDVSNDGPSGWEQTGQLIGALALVAIGLVALAVGGPLGAALGIGLSAAMAYGSYRQGGWSQLNRDYNPFMDFFDGVCSPGLSFGERLGRIGTAGLKALGLFGAAASVRRGAVLLSQTASAARVRQAAGRALAAARARFGNKVAEEAKDHYRRILPDPELRAYARVRRKMVEEWDDAARRQAQKEIEGHLGIKGALFSPGPFRPNNTPLQISPNGCWAANIRAMRKKLGMPDMSEQKLFDRAARLGILKPDGSANSKQYLNLMRRYGMDASLVSAKPEEIANILAKGDKAVSVSFRIGMDQFHRVAVDGARTIKGKPYFKIGDPGYPEPYYVPLEEFAKRYAANRVIVAGRPGP